MQSSKKSSTFAVGFEVICLINQVFLAQLVEQLTLNQWVQGSSPWEDTKDIRKGVFFCVPPAGREPSIGPQKHLCFRESEK